MEEKAVFSHRVDVSRNDDDDVDVADGRRRRQTPFVVPTLFFAASFQGDAKLRHLRINSWEKKWDSDASISDEGHSFFNSLLNFVLP